MKQDDQFPDRIKDKTDIQYEQSIVFYMGKLKDNKPNGEGAIFSTTETGTRLAYAGEMKEGRPQGKGVLFVNSGIGGCVNYIGDFKDGNMDGKGAMYDSAGVVQTYNNFATEYKGVKEKYFDQYTAEQQNDVMKEMMGYFQFLKMSEVFESYTANESIGIIKCNYPVIRPTIKYQGSIKDNKYDGKGTLYGGLSTLWYDGEFKNGTFHGNGTLYYALTGVPEYKGVYNMNITKKEITVMRRSEKAMKRILACVILCMSWIFFVTTRTEAATINSVPLATDDIWVSGSIDTSDEQDFYTVHMPSDGWLTVGYQAFDIGDSYIEIKNNDMTKQYRRDEIWTSSATSPITESYELALEQGDYTICIYGCGSHVGEYRVKASFKPAENNESSSNDTFDTAMEIGLGTQVTGFLSIDDRIDFYKINVPYKKMVRLIYTARIPDSYIEIWNSDYVRIYNKEIWTAAESKPFVNVFEQMLEPGTYYIKILPCGGNTGRYTLLSQEKIVTQSIKISGKNKVVAGKTVQLKASLNPANVTDPTIEWSSGDNGIATVDQNGKVTTYRAERVNITVSAKDGSNTSKVFSLIVTPKKMDKPYAYNYYKKRLYVSWQTQSGVNGYQVQYSTKKNFSKATTKKISASSSSYRYFSGVKKAKYYVRVRSYVKVGKKYYYGAWSKTRTINVKR